ncbi:MAG: DNA mismatch repair endonuclease MutL [Clostridiales bacterium]|nr:DNA mismatch repair endonuclease MutL [Clostridiales bacterium]
MAIRVLDAATVGKIAAGEVVERPASIAKELIENSLDAGATAITVEVREGGISYLRVTDNGCGIPAGEVRIAFENHATSKITQADDLSSLTTLGFRGEALPSIAAVSKVEMSTRVRNSDQGTKLVAEGGRIISIEGVGCPDGTTIIIRDLFFNVPARQAFLKKPAYEYGAVSDIVSRLALGNPNISFRLIHNGKTIFSTYGDGNLRHAAMAVYDRETASGMLEIDEMEGGYRLKGLIGIGEQAKQTRAFQFFFINGRSVKCQLVSQALEACTQGRVMIGKYPMCILQIMMPPGSVDVNVHPNKLEVRFRNAYDVRRTMESLLYRAFNGETMLKITEDEEKQDAPPIRMQTMPSVVKKEETPVSEIKTNETIEKPTEVFEKPTSGLEKTYMGLGRREPVFTGKPMTLREMRESFFTPPQTEEPAKSETPAENMIPERTTPSIIPPQRRTAGNDAFAARLQEHLAAAQKQREEFASKTASVQEVQEKPAEQLTLPIAAKEEQPMDSLLEKPAYRVIGVLFKTYILVETRDSLILIDQHAAFERLKYEEYSELLNQGNASQQLLIASIVRISARERADLLENQPLLKELGYDIEPFGESDIKINAVPHVLGHADPQPVIRDLLENLHSLHNANSAMRRNEILQLSCKHAIKAGDSLTEEAIDSLVKTMLTTGAPPSCPHGRPVAKRLSRRELEQMFKRIV